MTYADDRIARPSVERFRLFGNTLGVWLGLAVIAVVNGVFREVVLVPRLGESSSHVISTGLLIAAILLISFWYFGRQLVPATDIELLLVGIMWSLLTVGFEFVVGFVEGTPIAITLAQYNLFGGSVWISVPLTLLVAPLVFGSLLSEY